MNDSYKNPFSGVNASQMDDEAIFDYWCSPFNHDMIAGLSEPDLYQDEMNIVFVGGRTSGKSMFLRYWSYSVQSYRAKTEKKRLLDVVTENRGVGFYFRIDGPSLKTFRGFGLPDEHWEAVFSHYFELLVASEYINFLRVLEAEGSLDPQHVSETLQICRRDFGFEKVSTLDLLAAEIAGRLRLVDVYRGEVAFYGERFKPGRGKGFASNRLSYGLADVLVAIPELQGLNIVLLVDEYENFLEYQQQIINALLKFSRPNIKYRIGMRPEGIRTPLMIGTEDFIKEGREYRRVEFEELIQKDVASPRHKAYQEFLIAVARRRLEYVPQLRLKGFTDIRKILSSHEDLEKDAQSIAEGSPERIYEFFAKKLPRTDLDQVRCPEQPLMELMNFVWLTRRVTPELTRKAMDDYLCKRKTEEAKKYQNDYIRKYKLSLMFLLCSIYHKNKYYYSFNTFAFLSSGMVGHFIELCRKAFDVADWGDDDSLLNEGRIDKELQHLAALEVSQTEKRQISRIEDYGGKISKLVENLGNLFREYKMDFKIKYPETNQIAVNRHALENEELRAAMSAAIKWSIIQEKPRSQTATPGRSRTDIYTLNRIFSPTFEITYRTRGGFSVELSEEKLWRLFNLEKIDMKEYFPKERQDIRRASQKLFDDFE